MHNSSSPPAKVATGGTTNDQAGSQSLHIWMYYDDMGLESTLRNEIAQVKELVYSISRPLDGEKRQHETCLLIWEKARQKSV